MTERPGPSACYQPRVVPVTDDDLARLEWATGRERTEFASHDRLRQHNSACVLLGEDGCCSAYGARPTACESVPRHVSSQNSPSSPRSEPDPMSEPEPLAEAPADPASPEAIQEQIEERELVLDKAFEAEYIALCEKYGRRIIVDYRLFVKRMK